MNNDETWDFDVCVKCPTRDMGKCPSCNKGMSVSVEEYLRKLNEQEPLNID